MSDCYAGIGSRQTPGEILDQMTALARYFAENGWILRSGHASGADQAFEAGAFGKAEIYLPWPSFESQVPVEAEYVLNKPSRAAWEMASKFHPAWERLSPPVRTLHARNCHQVLGRDLNDPVAGVVCWTRIGRDGKALGGTAQAIRIAHEYGIYVWNLATSFGQTWANALLHGVS